MSLLLVDKIILLEKKLDDVLQSLQYLDIEVTKPSRMAEIMGVSRQTVYNMMDRGEIKQIEPVSNLIKKRRAKTTKRNGSNSKPTRNNLEA